MSDALYSARHLGFRIGPMSWSTTGIVLEANSTNHRRQPWSVCACYYRLLCVWLSTVSFGSCRTRPSPPSVPCVFPEDRSVNRPPLSGRVRHGQAQARTPLVGS